MKYVYMILSGLLLALVLVFALQNLRVVQVLFLDMSLSLPLALLIIGVYVLGMLTGGFCLSMVRAWIRQTGQSFRQ